MIEIKDLNKKYRNKQVISGVDLSLNKENYGLVGPNGAGKTTLIRMLAGVIRPTSGEIKMSSNYNIGYLSQKFGCIPELTVYEQLEYFACLKRIPDSMKKEYINRALELVHLDDKRNEKCQRLSGGMIRRVGIGQAILGRPELILLDEPTVGLDPDERKTFSQIIGDIKGTATVLLSTHIISDVKNTCDKMIVLDKGSVVGRVDLSGYGEEGIENLYFEMIHNTED
jgi:ABC-2 type transport system ATP-binding protein